MTERGGTSLRRSAAHLDIGPSGLCWDGKQLVIDIDEWTVPIPKRLVGRIVIEAGAIFENSYFLDRNERHWWRPIAPCAKATVTFDRPGLDWRGKAYIDINVGSEPLEAGFRRWNWQREDAGASTRILYDVEQRDGARHALALDYRPDGSLRHFAPAQDQTLPRTKWLVSRGTRADASEPARVLRTLEDTPFYSRSMLCSGPAGAERKAVHESVDLDRFASPLVQMMLPFKMPRRG